MAERQERAARADAVVVAWARLILLACVLFVMIGANPYQHELVFDPLTGGAIINPANRIIWLGLFACSLPVVAVRLREILAAVRYLLPLLLLFGWFIVTVSWSIDPDASSRRLLLYVVALVICSAVVIGIGDGSLLHRTVAQACAIVIVIDVFSWVFMPQQSMTELGLAAIHNHKNTLGAVMLFASMVITPYALSRPELKGRALWFGLQIAALALLFASLSKTSIALCAVSFCLGALALFLSRWRRRNLTSLAAICAAILSLAVLGWIIYCSVTQTSLLGPLQSVTFTQRTDVWSFVLQEIGKHPWRGVGFGAFWDVNPAVQPSKQTDLWFAQPDSPTNEAHNGYLDIAATTGLPGLLLALGLLLSWIVRGFAILRDGQLHQTSDRYYALFLCVFPLIFFIHNWMESSYFTANSAYGFIILLTGVSIELREMQRMKSQIIATSSSS